MNAWGKKSITIASFKVFEHLCTTVQLFVVSTAISACGKKQQIKYKEKFLMKNRRLFYVFFWRMPRNIVGRLCLIKSEKFGVLIILRGEISQWGGSDN